jgi:hypothetical protein
MSRDLTLSEKVQSFIETEDSENIHPLSREDRDKEGRAAKMIEEIVNDIISSRESLIENKYADVEKLVESDPEFIKGFLDDRFTRDLTSGVSGFVNRTMQLSRLQASGRASEVTNGYLREAVRTYIFGLPQASVALSRAALEQALKEKLALQLSGEFRTFQDLLQEARKWNILDGTMELCARDVANAGDEVMHEKPSTLSKALEILDKLRGILQHVYSVEGHY